ncbi:carbohydrate-binding family 9-like protein [Chryseolinea soli]|nr:carbohydrate-binding family 9-like protein [Chryseolinea soli]
MKLFSATSLMVLLLVSRSLAQDPYETIHIKPTKDFEITGAGDAAAWKDADWLTLTQRTGNKSYATKAKLLYSDKGIYVLFHCDDEKISATNTEDFADLWKEDVMEVFFWTDESSPLYFEYEISPLNRELALLIPNFDGTFLGWRPWHYEGDRKIKHLVTTAKGATGNVTSWTAEIFVPYKLLQPLQHVPPQKGTRWRMNMYRVDFDDGRSAWSWNKVKTNFHDYKNFGVMLFE